MIRNDIVNEIHKPARKNFVRRHVIVKGIDDLWQADLIDFKSLSKYNHGYNYILVLIDCFSKYAWTVPVKKKNKIEVSSALEKVFKDSSRYPRNLQTDKGTEFYNEHFYKLMKSFKINHYSTYSVKKASVVERLIRTLKTKLFKYFSFHGSYKWIGDPLSVVTKTYNNTKHRTTKYKPVDVNYLNAENVMENIKKSHLHFKQSKVNYKVGDHVRVSKYKSDFEKGYTPNWSSELFIIKKVNNTIPVTYYLEDLKQQPILGCFYEQEIQKAKHPNIYLIEKILKKKGNKLYVKWLGLGENSWINKKELL